MPLSESYKITIENKNKWFVIYVGEKTVISIINRLDINITQNSHTNVINIKTEALKRLKLDNND